MDQLLYTAYALIFVALSIWAWQLYLHSRNVGTLMTLVVSAAMVYENGILALGVLIGHSPLLEALSWLRFIGYAVIPPLLVISGLEMASRVGVGWAQRPVVKRGAWLLALALAASALFVEVIGRQLEPRILNDVVRYMWVNKGVPPLAVILMNAALIGFGFAMWRKAHYPLLLLGSVLLFVGDGLAAGKYVIGSGVELAFMVFIIVSEAWVLVHQMPQAQPAHTLRAGVGN